MSGFGSFGTQNQPGTTLFGGTSTSNTGTSPFGNPQQNNSQSGTSLFRAAGPASNSMDSTMTPGGPFGNTSNPSGGSGLFGNTSTQQQQPAPGGLFGGTANGQQQPSSGTTQPFSGGLFGNLGAQQQQQPANGSLFGNVPTPAPAQPTGGNLFGGTFGGTAGSAFGNTNTRQPAGGNLFGTAAGASGSTPTQQQPATGLFGSTTTTSAPATGGLFGNTNPLFGNKSPSSIFGSQATPAIPTTTTTTTTTTPSLFGQSSTATQPATSLLGQFQAKPSGNLFGSTTQPTRTGRLFGSSLAPPITSTSSLLGSRSSSTAANQQQSDPQSQFAALTQRIDAIAEAWNPYSSQCCFQHYFYNLVDPSQASLYGRPPNATNEALWQRAVRDNPDPTCLVPVLAQGFDALHTRVEAQTQQAAAQQEKLKAKRLVSLKAVHNDNNMARIQRAIAQNTQISHRLLKLIQHLHLLIPAVRSSAIRPEEEALRAALEEIEEEVRRPGGTSKMRGKLNELWALVGAVNAARERGKKVGADGPTEWTVVDEDGLKQIAQILADQHAGLEHLTKVLQRGLKDLRVVTGKGTEGENLSTEKLSSSTSSLHASTLR
ncbi:nucleoporin complex subunit 54-domain-containing protein [Pisolithus orientalis]|uniref:nucleoporin complex subunit 54-domain-containing protein n=1 Tax=Pisolithus orientalis TaxID=936130 RepID=UPI0022254C03|nr:nucleoporin complex subunit 54-domain-containing protein [Pisolithus orientalis]KAI6015133.1 nucleoporin complex subunit 54-domain-containing protein [Pisolithus orientalis]